MQLRRGSVEHLLQKTNPVSIGISASEIAGYVGTAGVGYSRVSTPRLSAVVQCTLT